MMQIQEQDVGLGHLLLGVILMKHHLQNLFMLGVLQDDGTARKQGVIYYAVRMVSF